MFKIVMLPNVASLNWLITMGTAMATEDVRRSARIREISFENNLGLAYGNF
jgi:hypothetical protein